MKERAEGVSELSILPLAGRVHKAGRVPGAVTAGGRSACLGIWTRMSCTDCERFPGILLLLLLVRASAGVPIDQLHQ